MSTATPHELSTAIRAHHRALAEKLDAYVADVERGATDLDTARLASSLGELTGFLVGDLLPHARGEEQTLYPAIDPILRAQGAPTATMRVDHEYIAEYARRVAESAQALRAASEHERPELARRLARYVVQLQALFDVHLAKEERVYLPLVEQAISTGDQHALLAALHDEAAHSSAQRAGEDVAAAVAAATFDVRPLPPAQRHELIFERFNALPVGGSMVLINDHNPKPLRYQLVAEYAGELLWEYLEQGPTVWRVRLGKAS